MNSWKDWKIEKIEFGDKDFPKHLKNVSPRIKQLYFRGTWDRDIFDNCVAVVGSRKISRYGTETIEKVIPELVMNKMTIVSGFMYGVDSIAHWECIKNGGRTIAVLGGGLDYLYPKNNNDLYEQILSSGGLVISEYESKIIPALWTFPQRNRIVAGLSYRGIFIVEAGLKSGSLITADWARKMKRKCFALPGQINCRNSEGTNWLIKSKNAEMFLKTSDITKVDEENYFQESLFVNLNENQKKITELLKIEELTSDEICRKLNISIVDLGAEISILTMNGIVEDSSGKIFLKHK